MDKAPKDLKSRFRSRTLLTQLFTVMLGFSTLLMVIVTLVVSHQTSNSFIANNNLIYTGTLNASSQTLDALLGGYHDSLTHITYDGNIIDFVVTPKDRDSIANYQIWSVLNGYCQENEAIEEVYFYVKNTDQVLTSVYETSRLNQFREEALMRQHFDSTPSTSIQKSGRTSYLELYEGHLYMVRDFPLNGEKSLGTLFMKIKPTALYQALSGSQTSYSRLLAYDAEWNPLFPKLLEYPVIPDEIKASSKDREYYNDHHYFLSNTETSHIRLVLMADNKYFTPSFQVVLKNSLPFFGLILILNSLLCITILSLSYMPVLKLTKLMASEESQKSPAETENEWDYLTQQFLNVSSQKHQLDRIVSNMIPKISKEFYFELLNGKPLELSYIKNILTNINSPIKAEGIYGLISITFSEQVSDSRKAEILTFLTDFLTRSAPGFFNYVNQQIDDSLYAVILQFESQVPSLQIASFEIKLEQSFMNSVKEQDSLALMELGPKCNNILNLSFSYMESLRRLTERKYTQKNPRKGLKDSVDDSIALDYHYFQTQLKIILKFIMNGENQSALEKSLEICRLLSANNNSEEVCKAFEYYRLAFLDTLASYHITEASEEEYSFVFASSLPFILENMEQPVRITEYMERFCAAAIHLLSEKYQKQQHKYLVKAKHYIENNYQDPDLSLNVLAKECHTTTSYLSRLFRESFGINFIDYLNQHRIDKAKELLLNTDETVKHVASATGFNSQQNFSRVFKKYTGVTPRQYKPSPRF